MIGRRMVAPINAISDSYLNQRPISWLGLTDACQHIRTGRR